MNMNKTIARFLLLIIGLSSLHVLAAPLLGTTWNKVKDKAKSIRLKADSDIDTMVNVQKSTQLVQPAVGFVGDLKQEVPILVELLNSLSSTLANLSKVGAKQYNDPEMRKETMLVLFKSALSKTDELFNHLFAILYNLDSIILKASQINFVEATMSDQFKQVLLACRSMARVTMTFFEEALGPDLLEFLYRIESINPEAGLKSQSSGPQAGRSVPAPRAAKASQPAPAPTQKKESKDMPLAL